MSKKTSAKILFESPSIISGEEQEIKKSDFEFEKKLGDGAFGHVWKVKHKITKEVYALKQVAKEKVIKMQNQFKREVYIMYNLNHPHIVKLYNHFEDENSFYLIMEFAEYGNLFHRLNRQKHFMESEAAQYFREVLLAVEYLHSHVPAIIHRDIKPENILLDKDNHVKLTDFGWSNYYIEEADPRTTICGTPEYLPPEMIERRTHDTSADIWCLGVLLYEMLVGHTPFKSPNNKSTQMNITTCKPKFPVSFPPQARDLISKMLVKRNSERMKIREIQEHSWLRSNPETRKTYVQKLVLIPLPQYHESIPAQFKCYKAMNEARKEEVKDQSTPKSTRSRKGSSTVSNFTLSDSDMSLSGSEVVEDLIQDVACRESIRLLTNNIEEKQAEMKVNKNCIRNVEKDLQSAAEIVKDIEAKILEKKEKLLNCVREEKILNSKLVDLNAELDEMFYVSDKENYKKKIMHVKGDISERSAACNMLANKKEKLMRFIREIEQNLSEKLEVLMALTSRFSDYKSDSFKNFLVSGMNKYQGAEAQDLREANGKTVLNNNSEELQVLKIKLNELKDNMQSEIEANSLMIRQGMRDVEIKTKELEKNIGELKIRYEEKKYQIIVQSKKSKESFYNSIKMSNELVFSQHFENNKLLKIKLKQDLNFAREQEHRFTFNATDFDKIYQKYISLKNMRLKVYSSITKERAVHFELRERKRKKQNQLKKLIEEFFKIKGHPLNNSI